MVCSRVGLRGPFGGRAAWCLASVVAALVCATAQPAAAQGLIVPEGDEALPRVFRGNTAGLAITALSVTGRIADRAADITVAQTVRNDGDHDQRVQFLFPLPAEAIVDGMTLLVDGAEYPAELLAAKEARDRFEAIVRRKQDPALLEWSGGRLFQTQVFPVPVGAERTVTVHYTRLLPRDFGLADLELPLSTATVSSRPVKNVEVRLTVQAEGLRTIYSPTHPVKITRSGDDAALVVHEATDTIPEQDFRLLFDTADAGQTAGRLLTYRPDPKEDGYFLFVATPPQPDQQGDDVESKTTVVVLDRSGSMSGEKIAQAREAVVSVLGSLSSRDRFNVLTYSDLVTPLFQSLQPADAPTLAEARLHAEGLGAGGGTNIHQALLDAIGQLEGPDGRALTGPTYLLFLTDGLPTVGVQDEGDIAAAVAEASKGQTGGKLRLVTFGVGHNVNSRLLDRLSSENHGFSEYVSPGQDIEAAVSRVARRLSAPVLSNATLEFAFEEESRRSNLSAVLPQSSFDLFAGQELIVVGRYRTGGAATATLAGTRGGQSVRETFEVNFASGEGSRANDPRLAFVEKLWATRRIGAIINQIDLAEGTEPKQELVEELVRLAKRHGILTQYTSFLADEDAPVDELALRQLTSERLEALSAAGGREGFAQRGVKNLYLNNGQFAAPAADNAVAGDALEFQREANPAAGGGYGRQPLGTRMAGQQVIGKAASGPVPATALPARGRFASGVAGADEAETLGEPAAAPGGKPASDAERAPKVATAGGQTLYRRGEQLRTAETLDVDTEKETPTEVERFSSEYFELYAANTAAENALLARQEKGEELLVRLRGTLYLIK